MLAGSVINPVASSAAATTFEAAQLAQHVRLIEQPNAAGVHQWQQFQVDRAAVVRTRRIRDAVRAEALQHETRGVTITCRCVQ